MQKGSNSFSLGWDDLFKVLKGMGIAAAGAGLMFFAGWLEALPSEIDFGMFEAIAVTIISTLVNLIRKYINDTLRIEA